MKHLRRITSIILAALLLVSCLPAAVWAAVDFNDADAERFGVYNAYSTYAPGETFTDAFAVSDKWFETDPAQRNDALGLLSMQLTAAAVEKDEAGAGGKLLRDLGFEKVGFSGFLSEDPDDCAYTWATKTFGDCTLVAVVVQSYALDAATKEKGWKQNFLVNGEDASGEHFALARAAEKAMDGVAALGGEGKVKYWITGQSRGGALANLIAAKLPARLEAAAVENAGIYAYTFEAPATVDAAAVPDNADKYGYIHNYVCSDDPVPRVPMWGMVRYGVDFQLNSVETDNGLQEALVRLGSPAADVEELYPMEEEIGELIQKLEARVSYGPDGYTEPSRADYSKERTDVFSNENGEEVTVRYSYQETCVSLMGPIFGGELTGLTVDALAERLNDLFPALLDLADAATLDEQGDYNGASPLYWKAATALHGILDQAAPNGPVSLTDADFYALLRLAGPILIDTSYTPIGYPAADVFGYAAPAINLAGKASSLTYFHHFDTVIGRLKVLAPQATLNAVEAETSEVQAGDPAEKLPGEIRDDVSAPDRPWLTVEEASWSFGGDAVPENAVSFLRVRLRAVGHLIPDDFRFTVGGSDPIGSPIVSYADGAGTAEAVWAITVGAPATVTVSFVTGNSAEAPTSIQVPRGSALAYIAPPSFMESYVEDVKTWQFDGWQDENGTPWNELVADHDLTVTAKWLLVLDAIHLSFPLPALGEEIGAPTLEEREYCEIAEFNCVDDEYNETDRADEIGRYELAVALRPAAGKALFAIAPDEYGEQAYVGTASVNGAAADAWFDAETAVITLYYRFFVTPFTDVPAGSWYEEAVTWAAKNEVTAGVGDGIFAPDLEVSRAQVVTMLWRIAGSRQAAGSAAFTDVPAGEWYADAVAWAAENGIVYGYPGGVFAPEKDITRQELVAFLFRFARFLDDTTSIPDLALNNYTDSGDVADFALDPMRWAVDAGVVHGTSETTLGPLETATRAQLVQMLYGFPYPEPEADDE